MKELDNIENGSAQVAESAAQHPASRLDMARVQRWAELLDSDPQARQFMRQRLAGGELEQLSELQQSQHRLELALEHGIPAKLAEVHLTAADPELLQQQALSLAGLLSGARTSRPQYEQAQSSLRTKGNQSAADGTSALHPLPAYEAAPVERDEWLQRQFVALYQH